MKLKSDPDNEFPGGVIGSGSELRIENGAILLDAHEDDILFLSEANGSLSITVNGVTVELGDFESQNLVVRSNPASVVADNSVTMVVKGLFQRPLDHPKSTSKSAGFAFRGLYRKWELNKFFKTPKKN